MQSTSRMAQTLGERGKLVKNQSSLAGLKMWESTVRIWIKGIPRCPRNFEDCIVRVPPSRMAQTLGERGKLVKDLSSLAGLKMWELTVRIWIKGVPGCPSIFEDCIFLIVPGAQVTLLQTGENDQIIVLVDIHTSIPMVALRGPPILSRRVLTQFGIWLPWQNSLRLHWLWLVGQRWINCIFYLLIPSTDFVCQGIHSAQWYSSITYTRILSEDYIGHDIVCQGVLSARCCSIRGGNVTIRMPLTHTYLRFAIHFYKSSFLTSFLFLLLPIDYNINPQNMPRKPTSTSTWISS